MGPSWHDWEGRIVVSAGQIAARSGMRQRVGEEGVDDAFLVHGHPLRLHNGGEFGSQGAATTVPTSQCG